MEDMRDREDGKEPKWGEPSRKHDCSCAPYVNYGIKWINQILPGHIILHQGGSHSTKCGLGGNRVHSFIVTEQLGQCSKKQKELEGSAEDPEWIWVLLSFTSRKSISMLCTMIQDAVFVMVPFYRCGDWVLEKKWSVCSQTWPILHNLTYACLCFSLPRKPCLLISRDNWEITVYFSTYAQLTIFNLFSWVSPQFLVTDVSK